MNYSKIAKACFDNSTKLTESANILFKHKKHELGLFTLLTSLEELQKAIFCLFVHRRWSLPSLISLVFSDHEVKATLFYEMFVARTFAVYDNMGFLNGKPINKINLKDLVYKHKQEVSKHKSLREGCLFVNKHGILDVPKNPGKINALKVKTNKEIEALIGIFKILQGYSFRYQTNNFHFYHKKGVSTIQFDEI